MPVNPPEKQRGPRLTAEMLRRGFKVALCEQMEDPKTAKTVVRR